jgi:hypothetical protein
VRRALPLCDGGGEVIVRAMPPPGRGGARPPRALRGVPGRSPGAGLAVPPAGGCSASAMAAAKLWRRGKPEAGSAAAADAAFFTASAAILDVFCRIFFTSRFDSSAWRACPRPPSSAIHRGTGS